MRTLAYAASLQQPVLAVHISLTEEEARRFRDYWTLWGDHLPLGIVTSPYLAVVAPLVNYLEALHRQNPDLTLTVILPEIITQRRRHQLLHDHTPPASAAPCARCPKSSSPPCPSTCSSLDGARRVSGEATSGRARSSAHDAGAGRAAVEAQHRELVARRRWVRAPRRETLWKWLSAGEALPGSRRCSRWCPPTATLRSSRSRAHGGRSRSRLPH